VTGVEPTSPVGGPIRCFSPCCPGFASAKRRPPRRKFLEYSSPTGASSFRECRRILKRFSEAWAEIRPRKPVRVRLPSP